MTPNILAQLSPRIVPVEVTLPYGGKVTITMFSMTMHRWDELGEAVSDPTAPYVETRNGQEIRNYNDPAYLRARRLAESERAFRRLTYALAEGGNAIEGTLFEDKVKRVQESLDLGIASALMRWQSSLIAESRARVASLAATFPPPEAPPPDADTQTGTDAAGVEVPVGS